jgi:hypothetical protein
MRTQQIGRILQQVGTAMSGTRRGTTTRGHRTRGSRGSYGRYGGRRGAPAGGSLGRMVSRFLR